MDPTDINRAENGEDNLINDYEARHHKFKACFNFRDIGGYVGLNGRQVKWGIYYRAGRQDRMTGQDLTKLKKLGIKTQLDLRRSDETSHQGRGPLESMGARYALHPVMPDGGSEKLNKLVGDTGISGERYLGYLGFDSSPWVGIFDVMADADQLPLLIHCTAGKDRTGVTTALLLSILGVDRKIIEADYVLTNRDVERQVAYIEETEGLPDNMSRETLTKLAGVPENAMAVFLDGLDEKYDGPLNYLESIGVNREQQQAIQAVLLAPSR